MNYDTKERLIELVRKCTCIYDPRHKNYKNAVYKSLIWEKIGLELGIPGTKAKELWRSLRDGYIRHKKAVQRPSGASRKYTNYTWSLQMSFLDITLGFRSNASIVNRTPESFNTQQGSNTQQEDSNIQQEGSNTLQEVSNIPQEVSMDLKYIEVSNPPQEVGSNTLQEGSNTLQESFQLKQSSSPLSRQVPASPSEEAGPSWWCPEVDYSTQSLLEERNGAGSIQPQQSPASLTESIPIYHRNKKKKQLDSVDHLFASYAITFKNLSVPNQAKIKVELAKLFANAEIEEFEHNLSNEPQNQSSRKWHVPRTD